VQLCVGPECRGGNRYVAELTGEPRRRIRLISAVRVL
jgi:hypothetical protein